jgi:hypothetical protein
MMGVNAAARCLQHVLGFLASSARLSDARQRSLRLSRLGFFNLRGEGTMRIREADRATARSEEHLEAALHNRLGGRVSNLQVIFHDAGVVLRGRTSTYYAKQLAQHAAMELAGLNVLANDIEVY